MNLRAEEKSSSVVRRVRQLRRKRQLILCSALLLLVGSAWLSLTTGVSSLSSTRLAATLLPSGWIRAQPFSWQEWVIFTDIRLLRVATAVVAGAGLAISGAAMQIVTSNPMASPFTTGISNAAAFGASIAILGGFTLYGSQALALSLSAFLMATLCSLVVVAISARSRLGPTSLILAGIALSYLFSALSSGMQYVANENQLAPILYWTFGDLGRASWPRLAGVSAVVTIGMIYIMFRSGDYSRLAVGDESAQSMGVPVARIRVETGLVITAIAATIISVTGVIGFIGLVAPHIASMLIGPTEKYRLPLTALVGSGVLLLADLAGRTIVSPVIIPVGIMVSLVGIPLFLWLIIRENRRAAL